MSRQYVRTSEDYREGGAGFEKLQLAMATAALYESRLAGRNQVPVRSGFVRAAEESQEAPPAAVLLRGGRGGEVKFKLLLSMLWIGIAAPHDVTQASRVWAQLIGLDDPEKKGAARVAAAARTLSAAGFLRKEQHAGKASRLFLLDETGTGKEYTHPGAAWDATSKVPKKDRSRYFRIPTELWGNGWIAALSGPALFMYLALLNEARSAERDSIWFSPAVADRRYGLTEVTRRKGLAELLEMGLIEKDHQRVGGLSAIRVRNTYKIDPQTIRSYKPGFYVSAPSSEEIDQLLKIARA